MLCQTWTVLLVLTVATDLLTGDAIDPAMAAIGPDGSACGGVPDLHGLIKAYGGETLAIGRPVDGCHIGCMAGK